MNVKLAALAAVVVVLCIVQSEAQIEEYSVVNTRNGPVRGRSRYTLFERNPYYTYSGIPFAKPPVGALRFKVFNIFLYFCFSQLIIVISKTIWSHEHLRSVDEK